MARASCSGVTPEILARDRPALARPQLSEDSDTDSGGDSDRTQAQAQMRTQAQGSDADSGAVSGDQGLDLGHQLFGIERLGHELVDLSTLGMYAIVELR